jgi:hypothetical protein
MGDSPIERVGRRIRRHPQHRFRIARGGDSRGTQPIIVYPARGLEKIRPSAEVKDGIRAGRIGWSDGTVGFKGVREEVWNFHIGGYQVCEKWLKDRKGRTLSKDDLAHYHKIVVALSETIRLMKKIDEVIEQHGGWPGAFQTGKAQP